ncbi:MAG TPA: hypothetical protein VIA45_10670 [Thermoanaerobaculia bacterium]
MRIPRETEETRPPSRICSNEGCGRPAEDVFCETCALERSLFRRDEREATPRRDVRTG